MNIQEFSDSFDVLLNSYSQENALGKDSSITDINLDEYEKSVFLTKAQEEVIINLYNGKNIYGDSFEQTEEMRRYLDSLVKTTTYTSEDAVEGLQIITNTPDYDKIFKLPSDIGFITLETVKYSDNSLGCDNGYTAKVLPVTHDEYTVIKDNPFRGPTKYKAIRLDYGDSHVELLTKFKLGEYYIKYLAKPKPIILINLEGDLEIEGEQEARECELNPLLHRTILQRAVVLAAASRSKVTRS